MLLLSIDQAQSQLPSLLSICRRVYFSTPEILAKLLFPSSSSSSLQSSASSFISCAGYRQTCRGSLSIFCMLSLTQRKKRLILCSFSFVIVSTFSSSYIQHQVTSDLYLDLTTFFRAVASLSPGQLDIDRPIVDLILLYRIRHGHSVLCHWFEHCCPVPWLRRSG